MIAEIGRGLVTVARATVARRDEVDADGLDRAPGPRRPAHPPAGAGPRGRRDRRDRHPGGGDGRLHRRARDGQHRAGRRHRGRRRAGVAARPRGGLLRRLPDRCGHRRAPGRAARRARRDGRLRRAGAGLLRRRPLRERPAADAAGAGVRQGVRRRHRPARAGPPAHRGRPDERERALGPARAGRLAGRRGGGDHRPRLPAHRSRRLPPARVPRVDGGLGRDRPRRQAQGLERHGRGLPPPPAADRRAGGDVRPDLQGQPAAALDRRRRGAARRPGRRDDRHRRHRPRAAPARGQGLRVGGRRLRDARPRDRAVDRAAHDGRQRPARLGGRRRADVLRTGADRPGAPTTVARSRSAHRPTSRSTTLPLPEPSTPPSPRLSHGTPRTPAWSCLEGSRRRSSGDVPRFWTGSSV